MLSLYKFLRTAVTPPLRNTRLATERPRVLILICASFDPMDPLNRFPTYNIYYCIKYFENFRM